MLAGYRSSIAVAAAAVNIARIELFRDRAARLDCSVFSIARGFCADRTRNGEIVFRR